jgi:hypothetical protein
VVAIVFGSKPLVEHGDVERELTVAGCIIEIVYGIVIVFAVREKYVFDVVYVISLIGCLGVTELNGNYQDRG